MYDGNGNLAVSRAPEYGYEFACSTPNFDFYIFDSKAKSEEDLKAISSNAVVHIRSRRSGDILPLARLANVAAYQGGDPAIFGHIQYAVRKIIEGEREDYNILDVIPSSTPAPRVSFQDESSIEDWPGEGVLESFQNRKHMHATFTSILGKLHASPTQGAKPVTPLEYDAVIRSIKAIKDVPVSAQNSISFFLNGWPNAISEDTKTLKYKDNFTDSYWSDFFDSAKDIQSLAFAYEKEPEKVYAIAKAVADISRSQPDMLRLNNLIREVIIDMPAPGGEFEPSKKALAEMLCGPNNPWTTPEQIMSIPAFQLGYQTDIKKMADSVRRLGSSGSQEALRNTIQFGESINWNPYVFTFHTHHRLSTDSPLASNLDELWQSVYQGKSIKNIVRKSLEPLNH